MKVALVYDRVNKWGGAERVLLVLHELFPDADLYTSVYNKERAKWAKIFSVVPSFLQEFPFAKDAHEFYPLLMPAAFESFNFDDYDLVISVTSEAAKGIITKPQTLHICYCLTPTRYLWSGYDEYFTSPLEKILSYPAISYLRKWDRVASSRPDVFVAISKEVSSRIKTFYEYESDIIHPPVALIEADLSKNMKKRKRNYYLVVSRLVHYKRIDLAIQSCNRLSLPLKIVGTGSQLEKLKKISGPTIEFIGEVSDEELISLYGHAKGLLFPGSEDFGIVMVEALGTGTPVIAYKKGGAVDIIENGKSGILFPHQSVESLIKGIKEAEKKNFKTGDLKKRAQLFSASQFKRKMKIYIDQSLQKRKISL
jgi:glycosyltransferase involved in cell wall biosynthesis